MSASGPMGIAGDGIDAKQQPVLVSLWPIVRENITALSGVGIIFGLVLSTIFLFAYLSVFDWHLAWFIQYTDIITFGLIGLGIISGSFFLINSLVQVVLNLKIVREPQNWKEAWKGLVAFVAFLLLLYGGIMYLEHLRPEPHYQHFTSACFSILAAVSLPTVIAMHVRYQMWPTIGQLIGILLIPVIGAGSFGEWLGGSVLYSPKFDQDIFTKGETIEKAKLIAVFSRHTLILKDKVVFAFPTADVLKFETAIQHSSPQPAD